MDNIYAFSAKDINGNIINFEDYKNNVLLIVNTASKCGLTPQFKELEELHQKYKDKNLKILGFPCNQFANQEPGTEKEIINTCLLNYGVSFQMFSKINVNGKDAHPIYKFLKDKQKGLLGGAIKWNFTKFLVDSEGNVVKRYSPQTTPNKIENDIINQIRIVKKLNT